MLEGVVNEVSVMECGKGVNSMLEVHISCCYD